jgi:succinate dehydrogenase/fumarate reductase flavoprotein subunit
MSAIQKLSVVLGLAAVGGVLYVIAPGPVAPTRSASVGGEPASRRELRTPLSPALFVGKSAHAHEVAARIPDVLDHLYCYCECDKHVGHKSLLSCFTDGHAAT